MDSILFQLTRAELSGFGITGQIHKKHGILMSSGTEYSMKRRGLIEARPLERKRLYTLPKRVKERKEMFADQMAKSRICWRASRLLMKSDCTF